MDKNAVFELVIVNGVYALYSESRIKPDDVPDHYQIADIRGNDDNGEPYCIEPHVAVNYCGTLIFRNKFMYPRGTNQLNIDKRGIEYTCIATTLDGYGGRTTRRSVFNVVRGYKVPDIGSAKRFVEEIARPGIFYQYKKTEPGEFSECDNKPQNDMVFTIMGIGADERVPYMIDYTLTIEGFPVSFMRKDSIEQLEKNLIGTTITMVYGNYRKSNTLQN